MPKRLHNSLFLLRRYLRLSGSLRFHFGPRWAKVHRTFSALRLWQIMILSSLNTTLFLYLCNIKWRHLKTKFIKDILLNLSICRLAAKFSQIHIFQGKIYLYFSEIILVDHALGKKNNRLNAWHSTSKIVPPFRFHSSIIYTIAFYKWLILFYKKFSLFSMKTPVISKYRLKNGDTTSECWFCIIILRY